MINIITALPSEARPIIEHLSLAPIETHQKPHLYGKGNIKLAISGVGSTNAESAVERLAQLAPTEIGEARNAWINIGIAGHQSAPLGRCFIVDKIKEEQSGLTVYPSIPYRTRIASASLRTVSQPNREYLHNDLYDMEAYAFHLAAQRHSTLELIVLLKIVSDNKEYSIERINRAVIHELVDNALPELDETIERLQSLILLNFNQLSEPDIHWQNLWHTTYAQRQIISELFRRLDLLDETVDALALIAKCKSAKAAIAVLNYEATNTQLRLTPTP